MASSYSANTLSLSIIQNNSYENAAAAFRRQATAGAFTATWPLSYGGRWATVAVVFYPAGAGPSGSQVKAYVGGSFQSKPLKVYNGSSFVEATLKRWNGSSWVTV